MKKIEQNKVLIIKQEELDSTWWEQALSQVVLVEREDGMVELLKSRNIHGSLAGKGFHLT